MDQIGKAFGAVKLNLRLDCHLLNSMLPEWICALGYLMKIASCPCFYVTNIVL